MQACITRIALTTLRAPVSRAILQLVLGRALQPALEARIAAVLERGGAAQELAAGGLNDVGCGLARRELGTHAPTHEPSQAGQARDDALGQRGTRRGLVRVRHD